jgi:chlorobactene glucosyltransferase
LIAAAVLALLALVNLAFAVRNLELAIRSHAGITPAGARDDDPLVSIVVPARNEARQIEGCVRTLLAQQYPRFEVIVVDDRSQDDTARIVDRIARTDSRARLIQGEELPPGWVGKPWALTQGERAARADWLLFTDADTMHEPHALASAIAYAREHEIDALSLLTEQVMVGAAERLLLPGILWTIAFAIGPLADVNDMRRENALFNGQYLLVRRNAYEAVGRHATVAGEIAEDLELARRFKADGRFKTTLAGSSGLVRTRMYRSFGEIWEGFVKNFALGARGRPWLAAFGITFFACISPLAPIAAILALAAHAWIGALILIASMAIAIACATLGMRRVGFGYAAVFSLPVGIAVMLAIFATSLARHARGGVTWRGRKYA